MICSSFLLNSLREVYTIHRTYMLPRSTVRFGIHVDQIARL
jgi:hypothetical protein